MNVTIPDEVLDLGGMTADELMVEIAAILYQRERVSLGKAAELANLGTAAFLRALGHRGIPLNYDVGEFEQDLETLRSLRRDPRGSRVPDRPLAS